MNPISYTVGLDLGHSQDFTALCVIERHYHDDNAQRRYVVKELLRFPLGTPYPKIVDQVKAIVRRPPLSRPPLVIDKTGVGAAVTDMFRTAQIGNLYPVLITAGHKTTKAEDGSHHVPKKELVSILQVLLQTGQLRIAKSLPMAGVFLKEALDFKVTVTLAGNETFGNWREKSHDDLVLAVALACWKAMQWSGWKNWTPPEYDESMLPWALQPAQRDLWAR